MPTREPVDVAVDERPAPSPDDATHGGARDRGRRRVAIELSLLVALLALTSATRWIDATTPRVLPALQALGPSLVPLTAFVAVVSIIVRQRRVAAAAAAVAAVQLVVLAPWWIAGDQAVTEADATVTVMAANMFFGQADAAAVVDAVDAVDVDVLVLSEATALTREGLAAAGIGGQLPHVVDEAYDGCPSNRPERATPSLSDPPCGRNADGAMIYSRHPLSVTDTPPPPATYTAPTVDVATPHGDVVVGSAHPVPPVPGHTALWHRELSDLASWATTVPPDVPLVVTGDFNATDGHPVFRRFADAGLRDAHREIGRGPIATWPQIRQFGFWVPPLFHLDHVLARGVGVVDAGTVAVPDTDHGAIWAELAIRPQSVSDPGEDL